MLAIRFFEVIFIFSLIFDFLNFIFSSGGTAKSSAYYGQGSGSIWLDDLQCSGSESSLFACVHPAVGSHNCVHGEDAGVICSWFTHPLNNFHRPVFLLGNTDEKNQHLLKIKMKKKIKFVIIVLKII